MPPHSRGPPVDMEHPGAGTLFVQGLPASSSKRNSLVGSRSRSRTPVRLRPSSNSRSRERKADKQSKWPPEWHDAITARTESLTILPSAADALLERGIGEYTLLPAPEGLLGRGKFSTVYKVLGQDGKHYALKHTPLHPHHPLIAARLLREPTLLAQLPPHPCLVGVEGWIRTEGHFYLIEQYAASHIPLQNHPLPLRPSRAAYILDQLVSVVRDCMHSGRVCHRDLKGENVLVDIETGDIVVLDLGLATQFSASEPKLTTCCGSPAFHSPEIVNALNHPPGAITYYGPELDIWCIALTLLSLLSSSRFPLGPSHRSRHTMASRVLDRLQELDTAYPPSRPAVNWAISSADQDHETKEWARVRTALRAFLEMDGKRRMAAFARYTFGKKWSDRLATWKGRQGDREGEVESGIGGFKQLSFLPTEVKYTLPLSVLPPTSPHEPAKPEIVSLPRSQPTSRYSSPTRQIQLPPPVELRLANPSHESDRRVLSYLKYLLRTRGILYHCVTMSSTPMLQLVVPLPPTPEPPSASPIEEVEDKTSSPWLSALFRRTRGTPRSASLPPKPRHLPPPADVHAPSSNQALTTYVRCFVQLEFTHPPRQSATRANSKAPCTKAPPARPPTQRRPSSQSTPASRSTSLAPTFVSRATTRNGAVSPPTPIGTGEESLAVASLQQALLKITELSPTPGTYVGGGSKWAGLISPRSVNLDLPPDTGAGTTSSNSVDSEDSSPAISTPATPGSATPIALPQIVSPPKPEKIIARPMAKRAQSTPRLAVQGQGMTSYRGLPPVSPSLALSPLPVITPLSPSPLSRQVSPTSSQSGIGSSNSGPNSKAAQSQCQQPSRASSRVHSRTPSRATSVSTSTSGSSTPVVHTQPLHRDDRSRSTMSARDASTAPTTTHPSPASSTDHHSRPMSYVILKISDQRALEPIRMALDVPHTHPVPLSPVVSTRKLGSSNAVGVPPRQSTGPIEVPQEEEQEERGRPRSREDPRMLGMSSGSGTSTATSAGTSHAHAPSGSAGRRQRGYVERDEASGGQKGKREPSTGRRMLGLLGLGLGPAGCEEEPVGPRPKDLGMRRSSGARNVSAPPVSKTLFGM